MGIARLNLDRADFLDRSGNRKEAAI